MNSKDTRSRLIEITKMLLEKSEQPETITAREISASAGTNLAMINYYFKSKDELLKIATDQIINEEFVKYSSDYRTGGTPKEQLRDILLHVSYAMIKYRQLTLVTIPYLMLKEEIHLPLDILPLIKAHYGNEKNETECRCIAFQLVYTMQLIFYRADDFYTYSGMNIIEEEQLKIFIDMQMDLLLGGK